MRSTLNTNHPLQAAYTLIFSARLSNSAPTRLASSSASVAFPSMVNASVIDGSVVAP